MSRIRFNGKGRGLRFACAASALLATFPAAGQETGLRGALGESRGNNTLLSAPGATDLDAMASAGIRADEYRPVSEGALPDEAAEDTGLSPDADLLITEDPLRTPEPPPIRGPSTEPEGQHRAQEAAALAQAAETPAATGTAPRKRAGGGRRRNPSLAAAGQRTPGTH